jgi:hypothetical protein
LNIDKENKIIEIMIKTYCRKKHNSKNEDLCEECGNLFEYAKLRLSKCPFGDKKPFCSKCEIHCYNAQMRGRIKEVMRFSGPKMIFKHPVLTLWHLLAMFRAKKSG